MGREETGSYDEDDEEGMTAFISEHWPPYRYVEELNDNWPTVKACGHEFLAGSVLREMDPVVFDFKYERRVLDILEELKDGGQFDRITTDVQEGSA